LPSSDYKNPCHLIINEVLEHIMVILREIGQRFSGDFAEDELLGTIDLDQIERELQEIVQRNLTGKEEWPTAGPE
jgi:hypothetical protein